MVEYNNNLAVPCVDEMLASDTEPKDMNIHRELVVIAGEHMGSPVKWIQRTCGSTRVYHCRQDTMHQFEKCRWGPCS